MSQKGGEEIMITRKKPRAVDYTHAEFLEMAQCEKKTFYNRKNRFLNVSDIDGDCFKKDVGEESSIYFWPIEWAEIMALLIRSFPLNPLYRKDGDQDKFLSRHIKYQRSLLIDIEKHLPAYLRDEMRLLPSFLPSLKISYTIKHFFYSLFNIIPDSGNSSDLLDDPSIINLSSYKINNENPIIRPLHEEVLIFLRKKILSTKNFHSWNVNDLRDWKSSMKKKTGYEFTIFETNSSKIDDGEVKRERALYHSTMHKSIQYSPKEKDVIKEIQEYMDKYRSLKIPA